MPVEEIVDSRDDRLAGYRDLTDVALRVASEPANGVYIAESASVIERALDAGHEPFSILMEDKWLPKMKPLITRFPDVPVYVASTALLQDTTGFHVHAICTKPHWKLSVWDVGGASAVRPYWHKYATDDTAAPGDAVAFIDVTMEDFLAFPAVVDWLRRYVE